MALTTTTLRAGLSGRVATVSGLREAKGPLGVTLEPSTVIDRSYEVEITEDTDGGERVRAGARMSVTAQFVVRLVHKLAPKGGADVRDQAYNDTDAVRRALLTHAADGIRECENTITYGGSSREARGGGVYLLTTMRWAVRYDCSLVA